MNIKQCFWLFDIHKKQQSKNKSDSDFKKLAELELLRQSIYTFNLTLFMTCICTVFSLFEFKMILSGTISEHAISASIILVSSLPCFHLLKNVNNRLHTVIQKHKIQD